MFLFKKIFSNFFFPVPLIVIVFFLGLFYLWFTRKQTTGKLLITAGFIFLFLLSNNEVSNKLIGPLENMFSQYEVQLAEYPSDMITVNPVKYIVVLGGGHVSDPGLPTVSQLNRATLVRLVEGIRLYRRHPGSKLVLSGGKIFDPVSEAEHMSDIAKDLGVDENDIILEDKSRDTKDEAVFLKPVLKKERFILVTSASHMYRSVELFKKLGMDPIPAPVGHFKRGDQPPNALSYFPSSWNLYKSRRAVHEYLGFIWASFRGQI